MSKLLVRWVRRTLIGAVLYPVMHFVVLPMLGEERVQPRQQVMSSWENVTKQLGMSETTGVRPSSSEPKANRQPTQRPQASVSTSSVKFVDVNGSRIGITPALNTGKSVVFETSQPTSSSSTSCKPGGT